MNQSPSKRHDFKYSALNDDESYNSTVENVTEESVLSRKVEKDLPLLIDRSNEEVEITTLEPLYATVQKDNYHLEIVKELSQTEKIELKTFQSPLMQERFIENDDIGEIESMFKKLDEEEIEDENSSVVNENFSNNERTDEREEFENTYLSGNGDKNSTKNMGVNEHNEHDDITDIENMFNDISEKEDENSNEVFQGDQLGFAFNFLSSQNTERNVKKDNNNEVMRKELKKKFSSETDDESSMVSVSSLDYIDNQFSAPTQSPSRESKALRSLKTLESDHSNRRQKEIVIDLDSPSMGSPSLMQNFQPKHLTKTNYINEEAVPRRLAVPSIAIEQPSPKRTYTRTDSDSPTFDIENSLTRRYSNFSINDIIRQDFLPTTRLDYTAHNVSNESESHNYLSFDDQRDRRGIEKKLSKLNIQNQYQSERNRSTPSFDTSFKLDEPKTYGKPVMTKSPRTDFLPSSTSSTLRRTVKENDSPNITKKEEQRNSINIPKLRKTKNSDLLLGNCNTNIFSERNIAGNGQENFTNNENFNMPVNVNKQDERERIITLPRLEKDLFLNLNNNYNQDIYNNNNSLRRQKEGITPEEVAFKLGKDLRPVPIYVNNDSEEDDFKINTIKSKIEVFSRTENKVPAVKPKPNRKNPNKTIGGHIWNEQQVSC